VNTLFRESGYRGANFDPEEAPWPQELWSALTAYATRGRNFMRVWTERQTLQQKRDKLAAAAAWKQARK